MSTANPSFDEAPGRSRGHRLSVARAYLRSVPIGVQLATVVLIVFLIAAIAPGLLQTHDAYRTDLLSGLKAPSGSHLFGTDQSGRDVFSRVVAGTRQSLQIGLGATGVALVIGLLLGVAAGLGGRWTDGTVSRFIDVLFSFPTLFLALLLVSIFGAGITTTIVAVGVGTSPGYARMVRGQFITVRRAGYVEAARAVGHTRSRIVRQHIFPNAIRPLVAIFTLGVGQSIAFASGLAYLGLGVAPPSPEWGALLDAGRQYVTEAWWLELMPGAAIVLFALSVTVVGRHVQERLEGNVKVEDA
ncbi:ABC transporter permease [Patulibacter sp. NPDC049589]|uniref:ABC transporter permease n=1 Tax=Patulibacter sp. NPDC049589 TaxID=3154731 RepID=UPI003445D80F